MYKTVVRLAMMIVGQGKGVQDCCKTGNDDRGVNGKVYKTVVRPAMMIVGQWKGVQDCCKTGNDDSGSVERCTRLL